MPKEPRRTGIVDGKFYQCPKKPICVSTQASEDDEKHYISPIKLTTSVEEAMSKIISIINTLNRTKILDKSDNYLRVQFTTALFRFKDDVEFYIDEKEKLIHFRSQSRIGGYDWNANRNRMEDFRTRYKEL